MAKNLIIRKAVPKDVPSIVKLWNELMDFHKEYDRHFTRSDNGDKSFADFLTGHISNDTSCVLVAEIDKDIVGYCLATISEYPPVLEVRKYGTIKDLSITKSHRRKRIGEKLFKEARKWFSEKDVNRIEVPVATSNKVAMNFWRKMEFAPYLETVFLEI